MMAPVGTPRPCRGGAGVGSVLSQSAYSRMSLTPSAWGIDCPQCIVQPTLLQALRKILTPPLPRLRPTIASLPNCSLLAIAYKGGECLRSPCSSDCAPCAPCSPDCAPCSPDCAPCSSDCAPCSPDCAPCSPDCAPCSPDCAPYAPCASSITKMCYSGLHFRHA